MAKIILTEEEKAAHSWLDLDDASLGRCVKQNMLILCNGKKDEDNASLDSEEGRILASTSAVTMLAIIAHKSNADHAKFTCNGVSYKDESIGNWSVTLELEKE